MSGYLGGGKMFQFAVPQQEAVTVVELIIFKCLFFFFSRNFYRCVAQK